MAFHEKSSIPDCMSRMGVGWGAVSVFSMVNTGFLCNQKQHLKILFLKITEIQSLLLSEPQVKTGSAVQGEGSRKQWPWEEDFWPSSYTLLVSLSNDPSESFWNVRDWCYLCPQLSSTSSSPEVPPAPHFSWPICLHDLEEAFSFQFLLPTVAHRRPPNTSADLTSL